MKNVRLISVAAKHMKSPYGLLIFKFKSFHYCAVGFCAFIINSMLHFACCTSYSMAIYEACISSRPYHIWTLYALSIAFTNSRMWKIQSSANSGQFPSLIYIFFPFTSRTAAELYLHINTVTVKTEAAF